MLNINIIHTGSFKEKYLREASAEYEKRISQYCRLKDIELKEAFLSDNPSESEIKAALACEEKKILENIRPGSYSIALCVEGVQITSPQLAEKFNSVACSGYSTINFIIGSSYGLSDNVKSLCDFKLSFSKMTFPHQLMRIILEEQIYRAFNISNNGKYHK
ncbi:MAG: 23S rRNA (pseudouridine(1915)-N(3))-methyltransferase RlmH [Ruminococcaceae bacterium]|nr:23S rRNA (pseudouridine(1915)-N(3))-methyltransferase RlmH [Oscillospiraceae bacterium]